MAWFRGAASFLPVVGHAVGAAESALHGDRVGAALELCGLAADVVSTLTHIPGVPGLLGSPTSGTAAVQTVHLAASTSVRLRRVVKDVLKRKVGGRLRRAAVKVGVAATGVLAETVLRRARPAGLERALRVRGTFAERGSADAKLHARLAREVYRPPASRRGCAAVVEVLGNGDALVEPQLSWYAYVGGDSYRGFWYSPGPRHLVLVERGTAVADPEDWPRDICLAAGTGLAAVSDRARVSKAQLQEVAGCHDHAKITVAGHSLGGAVAVFLGCSPPQGVRLDAVHAFNAGGVPDVTRFAACCLASPNIFIHRVEGDVISIGFLPLLQRRYERRAGCEQADPHRMLHFLEEPGSDQLIWPSEPALSSAPVGSDATSSRG